MRALLALVLVVFCAAPAPALAKERSIVRFERAVEQYRKAERAYRDAQLRYGADSPEAATAKEARDRALRNANARRRDVRRQLTHRNVIRDAATSARGHVHRAGGKERARALAALDRGLLELSGVDAVRLQKAEDAIGTLEAALKVFKPERFVKDELLKEIKDDTLKLYLDEVVLSPIEKAIEGQLTSDAQTAINAKIKTALAVIKAYKAARGQDGAGGIVDFLDLLRDIAGVFPGKGASGIASLLKAEAVLVKEVIRRVAILEENVQLHNVRELLRIGLSTEERMGNHWGLKRIGTHHWFTHVPARHRVLLPKTEFAADEAFSLTWETDFAKIPGSKIVFYRDGLTMQVHDLVRETPGAMGSGTLAVQAPRMPGAYEAVLMNGSTKVASTAFRVRGLRAALLLRKRRYQPGERINVEYVVSVQHGQHAKILLVSTGQPATVHNRFNIPATREARRRGAYATHFAAPLQEGIYEVQLKIRGHVMARERVQVKLRDTEVDTSVDLQQAPTTWVIKAGWNYHFKMTMRVFGAHLWGQLEGLNNNNPVTRIVGTAHHNIIEFERAGETDDFQLYVGTAYKTPRGWRLKGTFVWQGAVYQWCGREWSADPKTWDGDCDL